MAEVNHVNNGGNERKRTDTFKKIREGIKKWFGEVTSRDQVLLCSSLSFKLAFWWLMIFFKR